MTEAELLSNVLDLAALFKWKTMHQRPGLNRSGHWSTATSGQGVGWLDVFAVRERAIAIELKSERGRLTVEQQDWIGALSHAGIECFIWRPKDWVDGTIEEVLR